MNTNIAKEFHFGSLLRFATPTICMMVFMSLYTIVDGIFVSRFVGTDALSAINLVYPALNLVLAVGIMLATGGSAVVARQLGEERPLEARRNFTMIVAAGVVGGLVIGAVGLLLLDPICRMLGATDALMEYCRDYLRILLLFAPASVLQLLFQCFFVTAGRPGLGFGLTVAAGALNAVLDYLLIVPGGMGIEGAAWATAAGYLVPAVTGLLYFFFSKNPLRFTRPRCDWRILGQSCFNGSSEMVTNISTGVVTFLFNQAMMYYLGTDGVAAITIVLYAQFLLTALYLGFALGVAPVISYNQGCGNAVQLRRIFRICMKFIVGSSAAVFLLSLLGAGVLVGVFAPRGTPVYDIAFRGFILFSLSYLFAGLNIFSSGMFTAFSNGKVSAILSFMRTFVFITLGLYLLPIPMGVDGVWLAVPFAELLTAGLSVWFLRRHRVRYQYA